jgi:hypothetical protein
VFRGEKLPKTHSKLIVGATTVVKRDIMPTDAPIRALRLISLLWLHMPLPMEPTLFLLLPSRTTPVGVNHVAVEEALKAPNVLIGMFLINDSSVVMLFDSGASQSFISTAYVGKHNLPLALLKCPMIVSYPGGNMPARQLCPKVNLKIRGVDFVANLIVLESKGIDVSLRMDWLSKHKVLIDCAKKSIKLTTPEGKEMEFVVELVVTTKGATNRGKVNQLDASQGSEVPVVNEFSDVECPKSYQVCHLTETSSL